MFSDFVVAVQNQDKRNIFKTFTGDVSSAPEELRDFYKNSNPIDVVAKLDDRSQINFYGIELIPAIQIEYDLPKSPFCFATKDGDPVYYLDGKIYIALSDGGSKLELLADSFIEYIQSILKHMYR